MTHLGSSNARSLQLELSIPLTGLFQYLQPDMLVQDRKLWLYSCWKQNSTGASNIDLGHVELGPCSTSVVGKLFPISDCLCFTLQNEENNACHIGCYWGLDKYKMFSTFSGTAYELQLCPLLLSSHISLPEDARIHTDCYCVSVVLSTEVPFFPVICLALFLSGEFLERSSLINLSKVALIMLSSHLLAFLFFVLSSRWHFDIDFYSVPHPHENEVHKGKDFVLFINCFVSSA